MTTSRMTSTYQPELIAIIPWDDDASGIPSCFEDSPQLAWSVAENTRKVRSPVRIRLDSRGGFHLLGGLGGVLHTDEKGAAAGRTPLPERPGRIVDYACGADRTCVLLEQLDEAGQRLHRLRRLGPSGAELWARSERTSPAEPALLGQPGAALRLLLDGSGRLYVPMERDGIHVAEVDPATGDVRRILHPRKDAGVPFLAAGRLLSVFYDPQTNRRGISVLDPAGAKSQELLGTTEHFGWLVYPFGADDLLRLYVWRDGRIARISLDGGIQPLGEIAGMAVRAADRQVFTSRAGPEGVVVEGGGVAVTLSAPSDFRLVHVDAGGRYHLLGGGHPGSAGELRVYSHDGKLETTTPPPEGLSAIEHRLPLYDAWQVDAEGRVTIPLVTPEGVAIVRSPSR